MSSVDWGGISWHQLERAVLDVGHSVFQRFITEDYTMNESSQRDNAHERGKGVMNGGDLPMANRNTEDSMANSMPDTTAADLANGYSSEGGITGDTGSHAADMKPGKQNQGNDELGAAPERHGSTK